MDILAEAFNGLFPDEEPKHEMKLKYSGKFSDYNGNVYYTHKKMEFRLSRKWRGISREIKIGLIQILMQKVFNTKKDTPNIDMYNIFLKKVHVAVPVTVSEPELVKAFERVNQCFFNGMLEPANLKWATRSKNKYGSYVYGQDLISINPILKDRPELLDYVLYHEMLHKKLKFEHSSGRSHHHTAEFRRAEKSYPGSESFEKELQSLSRRQSKAKKRRSLFNWF